MTDSPTLLDALRDIAERCNFVDWEETSDGWYVDFCYIKLGKSFVRVYNTATRSLEDEKIFSAICQECRRLKWAHKYQYRIEEYCHSFTVCGIVWNSKKSPAHAAVLAFRKAIMADHTEQPPG